MIPFALLAASLQWAAWAPGYDFAASIEVAGFGAVLQVEQCSAARCFDLEVHVQASIVGSPASICAGAVVRVRSPRIFSDGFETGSTSTWGQGVPRPDGIVRMLIPWRECGGKVATVASAGRRDSVTLSVDCVATTPRAHGGEVVVELAGVRWAARLPSTPGRIKLGTLEVPFG